MILHPLKSELTFAFAKEVIGNEHKHRYLVPEFLVHGMFCPTILGDVFQMTSESFLQQCRLVTPKPSGTRSLSIRNFILLKINQTLRHEAVRFNGG